MFCRVSFWPILLRETYQKTCRDLLPVPSTSPSFVSTLPFRDARGRVSEQRCLVGTGGAVGVWGEGCVSDPEEVWPMTHRNGKEDGESRR